MHAADSLPPAPPWAPLSTPRLTLRPYESADDHLFFELLDRNRERLQTAFPTRVASVRTLPDARRVLAGFRQDWYAGRLFVFGIWHTATGAYLGDISLRPSRGRTVTAEIGYYLASSAQGYGYAREALAAAVEFGFAEPLSASRLHIRCRTDNPRSHAVADHAGFQRLPLRPRLWPLRGATPEIQYFALSRPNANA